ncbi:MAG: hypothetical protein ACE5J2_05470 [Nitrososphaerales archaeon]
MSVPYQFDGFLKSRLAGIACSVMNERISKLKKYIDGTLVVMSGLAWHGVVTSAAEMTYPLLITAVSLAVILGFRAKERVQQLTH